MTGQVEQLLPVARSATYGLYVPGYDRDDLDQELRILILQALKLCDGRDPKPLVRVIARRRIISLLKRQLTGPTRALNDAVSDELLAFVPQRDSVDATVEARDTLHRMAAVRLSPVERHAVMGLAAGYTVAELGLEARVADNAAQRARRKLRAAA